MVLQLTGVALLAALVILLIKRKTYVKFPFFFAYILFSILSTLWLIFPAFAMIALLVPPGKKARSGPAPSR
jgi:hypothetical protein